MTDYPYVVPAGGQPRNSCNKLADEQYIPMNIEKVVEYRNLTPGKLRAVIANYGPVAVAIYASKNFQRYGSGVLTDNLCGTSCSVNHAVLVVGYGTDSATRKKYWLIKNSWVCQRIL